MKTRSRFASALVTIVTGYLLLSSSSTFNVGVQLRRWIPPANDVCESHDYSARIFSLDPLIIHLSGFVNEREAQHLLRVAEGSFAPSQRVDAKTGKAGGVDTKFRKAETAFLKSDTLTTCIQQRAIDFQGHIAGARVEPLQVVRYHISDFVRNHFDWFSEETVERLDRFGRRDTSFFFYLHANCTGGGTNFPRLKRPDDPSWCDVIDCEEPVEKGVTFKAITNTGVFWQNWHVNGTPRYDVLHSGTPLTAGTKVGLNLWSSAPRNDSSLA